MLGRKKKKLHGKSDTLLMHAFAYQKCLNEDSSPQKLCQMLQAINLNL